jgi:K+-transporting ATPase ATPase C chain
VARTRGLELEVVKSLITKHAQDKFLGFLGEPRINVLELNLALEQTR